MNAIECILTRMSIRKFKPDSVSRDILEDVIKTAQRSPSYKNSQPWELIILSGQKKAELTKILTDLLEKKEEANPDIAKPSGWPAEIEARIKDNLEKRSKAYGIDLADPESIIKSKKANYRFYGAPHCIFLFQDASLNEWSIFDMGIFTQSIMLAANARGLGTVPQAYLIDYSSQVRKFLGIPESKRLVLGMSIGYPENDDRINSFRTERVDVNQILRWIE